MKTFYSLLFSLMLITPVSGFAEDEAAPKPLNPIYNGEHYMVLVSNGTNVYASFMPGHESPKNLQLVYDINGPAAMKFLVRDADLVTMRTKRFNLERLMRGEEVTIQADIYMGHASREGSLTFESMEIVFEEQLYLRMLEGDELEASSSRQKYDSIELSGSARMLVHQVQSSPSYDHLVLLYDAVGCVTEFNTSSPVPNPNEVLGKLLYCGSMKPLYFDSQDLQ